MDSIMSYNPHLMEVQKFTRRLCWENLQITEAKKISVCYINVVQQQYLFTSFPQKMLTTSWCGSVQLEVRCAFVKGDATVKPRLVSRVPNGPALHFHTYSPALLLSAV
ncbi:hypothetical protein XENOCAPTIV_004426 [Xenoophorus captivus]|uniref:Uncharacterized protein n=1 Tax=Xenoophorus captivus TaxID=1517983 RepID=A0ABV0QGE7_9TELE